MIKSIIFDMNGVLIDDEHIHELAFAKVLNGCGIHVNHEEYSECCAGRTDKEGFEKLARKFKIPIDADQAVIEKGRYYLSLFPENKKTYPGAIELVEGLSKKYILALTSSSRGCEIDLILKTFKIKDLFQTIISAEDVKKGKPDPEPYLLTAKKLEIQPEDCVVIEDSPAGVSSALAAGMTCIGVTTTHSREELKNADQVFDTFGEIQKYLMS